MLYLKGIFVSGTHMAIAWYLKVAVHCFFGPVVRGLHVDYVTSAVQHVCDVVGTFGQGHM